MKRIMTIASASMAAALLFSAAPAEAKEVSCTEGTNLRASNGDTKSTITFTNRTPDKQTVYWIDYDGKRHKYQELDPGESYDQPTFLTHPWLVTGLRDECVGYYLAEGAKTSVEAGIAPVIKPKTKKNKVAEIPKVEERVAVRKPTSSFRTPGRAIPDDDFESDDDVDEGVARRQTDRVARSEPKPLSDSDFDDGDDFAATDDPVADGREDGALPRDPLPEEDNQLAALPEDDDDEFEAVEPLPRKTARRRAISPEWGDEPLTNRRQGLARNWRCTEYSTRTERAICNSQRLSRLDDELEQLYSSLVRALPRFQRTKLRRRQQGWLEDRETCGQRTKCIERRTLRRLARLNERMERAIARRSGASRRNARSFARVHRGADAGGRLPTRGRSLGGRVRDIPGLDGRRIASLREGAPVTILESTGERHQGYEWFKVRFSGGTGYTWGGILCTNRRVPGVYQVCR